MRKFWDKYKNPSENYKNPSENYKNTNIADESLPILAIDGSTCTDSNLRESQQASLPRPPGSELKSESNPLATPSNPVGD